MNRLLVSALLVASAAPAWAQGRRDDQNHMNHAQGFRPSGGRPAFTPNTGFSQSFRPSMNTVRPPTYSQPSISSSPRFDIGSSPRFDIGSSVRPPVNATPP